MINISIIGKPSPEQREAFKQAKATLAIGEAMLFVPAAPGCGKVIIFAQMNEDPMPDFAADWMTIFRSGGQDVEDALAWYVGIRDDWRAASPALWLERTLGISGVRELV